LTKFAGNFTPDELAAFDSGANRERMLRLE
jgi:hypothetical protein